MTETAHGEQRCSGFQGPVLQNVGNWLLSKRKVLGLRGKSALFEVCGKDFGNLVPRQRLLVLHRQHRDAVAGLEECEGIAEGARGNPAAVPGDGDMLERFRSG